MNEGRNFETGEEAVAAERELKKMTALAKERGSLNLENPGRGYILTGMEHRFMSSTPEAGGLAYNPNAPLAVLAGMKLDDLNRFRDEFSAGRRPEQQSSKNETLKHIFFYYFGKDRDLLLRVRLLPLTEEQMDSSAAARTYEIIGAYGMDMREVPIPEDVPEYLDALSKEAQEAARLEFRDPESQPI